MSRYNIGDKFGEFTFLGEDFHEKETTGHQLYRKVLLECSCGKRFVTRLSGIGNLKSCGCIRKNNPLRISKHNMTNSTEYSSWESMKARCLNPKCPHYRNYGARGIKVCKRWLSFEGFFKDMGRKPDRKYSLERIDNNGNYSKKNCKWATKYEQERNKRTNIYLTYNGEKILLYDLAKRVGMHQQTIIARVRRGISVETAVTKEYKYVKSDKYAKV